MKKINEGIIYPIILFALSLLFFKSLLGNGVILTNGHYANDLTFLSYNIKESIGNGELPLWTHYFYSGQPLLAIPENYMFDLNFVFIVLFKNIYLAMNLSVILYLFIAGLGMFFLISEITENRKAALISSIIYMFNGYMHTFIMSGHMNILEGYALIPLIFLFVHKALKTKEWLFHSVLVGIFFALQILAGSMIMFFYTALIVGAYFAFNLINRKFMNALLKSFFAGCVIVAVCLGLAAIKILPVAEFTKMSSRSAGVSFGEFLGEPISLNSVFGIVVTNFWHTGLSGALGIAGFILLILGLFNYRKKIVVFSFILIVFSLLFASNTFVGDLMYKLPGFNKMRHVERSLVLFAFAGPIIAAYGFVFLSGKLSNKQKNISYVFLIAVVLVIGELLLLQHFPKSAKIVKPDDIGVLDYMSKDNSRFRVMNVALKDVIGASGYNYYSQKGISEAKGGGGIWINDYVFFLAVGHKYLASNILSVLNVKYIISDNELDADNMKLVGKFNECSECSTREAWGPYLYERKNFAPRFYIVPKSVLILGESSQTNNLAYSLILNGLDPRKIVLMEGSKVDDYSFDFLDKFDYIILLQGSASQENFAKLEEYKRNGGKLIPDILSGQNSISDIQVASLLNSTGNEKEVEVGEYSYNHVVLNLNGEKGWLVASERFAHFPGWKATVNGQEIPMLKADIAITSLYLDGQEGKLNFEYMPNSYKSGKIISIISVIAMLAYIAYFTYNHFTNKGGQNKA